MKKNTCVLIPSYNESRTIGWIVRSVKDRGMPVVVVDDGSTDGTGEIAQHEGAVVIRHDGNKGKGASMRDGFDYIVKEGFEAVLVMDGDGQHDINDADSLLMKMDEAGADMVIGNRMNNTAGMPLIRIITNRFMSNLTSRIAGAFIPDTQCGFRLIKTSILNKIRLNSSRYEIESELIIKAARNGFKIESVPVRTVYRSENSKVNPVIDTLRFISFLMRLRKN